MRFLGFYNKGLKSPLMKYKNVAPDYRIKEQLHSLEKRDEVFQLWQNTSFERKFSLAKVERVIPEKEFFLASLIEQSVYDFGPDESALYARDLFNNWTFKSRILGEGRKNLIVSFPEKLLLLEKRLFERFEIPKEVIIEVLLSVISDRGEQKLILPIEDISKGGMKLRMPSELICPDMNKDSVIMIHQLLGFSGIPLMGASIKRLNRPRFSDFAYMGLQFDEPLESHEIVDVQKLFAA